MTDSTTKINDALPEADEQSTLETVEAVVEPEDGEPGKSRFESR